MATRKGGSRSTAPRRTVEPRGPEGAGTLKQCDLDSLSRNAEEAGVHLAVVLDESVCDVWIDAVERTCDRKGAGGEALARLSAAADQAGLPVRAAVWACNEGLLAWFAKQGFAVERMPEDLESHDDHAIVVRHPVRPATTVVLPQHQEA